MELEAVGTPFFWFSLDPTSAISILSQEDPS
jgi:hypothetical protein